MWDADVAPRANQKQTKKFLIRTILVLIICYISVPLVFRYSSTVKSNLAFLNLAKNPFCLNVRSPATNYGFMGARNFYLKTPDGVDIGVWHLLPSELEQTADLLNVDDPYNATVATQYHEWLRNATVIIYCHGTAGSRASTGRLKLYRVLTSLNYHVVTFDYRGYGDSTGNPITEHDVIMDAFTVFNWVKGHVTDGHIFLWGHSLGSGVVSELLYNLEAESDDHVEGAMLESSFNTFEEALRAYPPSVPYSSLPGFNFFVIEPITNQGLTFRSEEFLKNVSVPLMFLHARDDHVVPYRLGQKLYDTVVNSRSDLSTVSFVSYNETLGYGHHNIHNDPDLGRKVKGFVEKSIARKDT